MAYDAFMWLEGGAVPVEGETTDKEYSKKKAFAIQSFSWGASNPVTIGSSSAGAGGGKVTISSFSIMKKTDTSSPTLFTNCCKGSHFDKAHVVLRKAGGTAAVEYIKYDFDFVFVDSINWSGASGGDDSPAESVSFTFGKCAIIYTPQASKGGGKGTPVSGEYTITENV